MSGAAARTDPRGLASSIMVLCRWIQNVSIGVWAGAILGTGMLVAPAAQEFFKSRVQAGQFLGPVFVNVTKLGIAAGILYMLMMFAHDSLWKRYHPTTTGDLLSFLRFVLAAGMVGASAYLLLRAWPRMQVLEHVATVVGGSLSGPHGHAFDWWHQLFEKITRGIFGGCLALMLLSQMARRRK